MMQQGGVQTMEMKKLDAGKLRAAGYDARRRVLRVEMDDGSALEYAGVGSDVWNRLSTSGAAWSYYRDNIEEEFTAQRGAPASRARPAGLDDLFRKPGDEE
jgi:hypothetical protein